MGLSDLSSFIDDAAPSKPLRVEDDFGNGFVRLRVSEAQRRQAKQDIRCVEDAVIEMLRNARDAHARTVFCATARSGDARCVVMLDDGDGIPFDMQQRIFEPRVTSKLDAVSEDDWGLHGRGMALYSIAENAEEAFVAASAPGQGSSFRVVFDVSEVRERKDQSTLPELSKEADGSWTLGAGPRNIARSVAQFALNARSSCTVYFGSPVEIAATLFAYGARYARSPLARGRDISQAPPACRLSLCADAPSFVSCAHELGLDVSERSAYRVFQGEVAALRPFLAVLRDRTCGAHEADGAAFGVARDFRGLKIAPEDRDCFVAALKRAWAPLAEAYYLESDIEPVVKVSHDGIRVTFPAAKQL